MNSQFERHIEWEFFFGARKYSNSSSNDIIVCTAWESVHRVKETLESAELAGYG